MESDAPTDPFTLTKGDVREGELWSIVLGGNPGCSAARIFRADAGKVFRDTRCNYEFEFRLENAVREVVIDPT
jgi:hypothetical protein